MRIYLLTLALLLILFECYQAISLERTQNLAMGYKNGYGNSSGYDPRRSYGTKMNKVMTKTTMMMIQTMMAIESLMIARKSSYGKKRNG